MTVTECKRRANRENSLKSTGPRTEEGKRAISMNALVHGARAESHILPGDDPDEVRAFFAAYLNDLSPASGIELSLASRMAGIAWKLERLNRAERQMMADDQIDELRRRQAKHRAWDYVKGKSVATNQIAPWHPQSPERCLIESMADRTSAQMNIWHIVNKLERTLLAMYREYRLLRKQSAREEERQEQILDKSEEEVRAADERRCTRIRQEMDESLQSATDSGTESTELNDLRSSASIGGSTPSSSVSICAPSVAKSDPNKAKVNLEKMDVGDDDLRASLLRE